MKISIAMATYMGGRHLLAQLDSIAAQSRLPDELVVSDDCSSDNTLEVLEAFSARAPFEVRISRNSENCGFAQNFSRAMSMATGDLVFLSDQDDVWFPEKIAHIEAFAKADDHHLCFMNDAEFSDAELRPSGRTKLSSLRMAGLPERTFVMGCCVAVRRNLLAMALPVPDYSPSHDNWLVQMGEMFGRVRRIDMSLQYYRMHGANTSEFFVNRAKDEKPSEKLQRILRQLWTRLRSEGGSDKEYRILKGLVERLSMRPDAASELAGGENRAASILADAIVRLAILEHRRSIRTLPRRSRLAPIVLSVLSGGYRRHSIVTGPIKDLLIPTSEDR